MLTVKYYGRSGVLLMAEHTNKGLKEVQQKADNKLLRLSMLGYDTYTIEEGGSHNEQRNSEENKSLWDRFFN